MKSSYWKFLAVACAASLLAVGCSKTAESKEIESVSQVEAVAHGENATAVTAEAPVAAAPAAAPVAAPDEARAHQKAIAAAPADTKAVRSFRGAVENKAAPRSGGTTITKETYSVTISAPTVSSGSEGSIKVTLLPRAGRKINLEFPTKLTVVPPAGVTVAKSKLKKGDADTFGEKKAIFTVKFKAAGAGDKNFTGKFKFAVCTESTCDPKTEKLAFKVPVK